MSNENGTPIPLSGRVRFGIGLLGAAILLLPVVAYIDQRAGLLGGGTSELAGFNIVYAILAGIGAIFILSAAIGYWVMWKDVTILDPSKPDPNQTTSTPAKSSHAAANKVEEPPFGGKYARSSLADADQDFVKVAENYYHYEMAMDGSFQDAVLAVFRSTPGRPSWYFLVKGRDEKSSWIKVPHAGRGGAGAGTPGK